MSVVAGKAARALMVIAVLGVVYLASSVEVRAQEEPGERGGGREIGTQNRLSLGRSARLRPDRPFQDNNAVSQHQHPPPPPPPPACAPRPPTTTPNVNDDHTGRVPVHLGRELRRADRAPRLLPVARDRRGRLGKPDGIRAQAGRRARGRRQPHGRHGRVRAAERRAAVPRRRLK